MVEIYIYIKQWEYLHQIGIKTINLIDKEKVWDFRVKETEFSIKETFNHTLKAIFEDAGNWFLNEQLKFTPTTPTADLERVINRMIYAIKKLTESDLEKEFVFQWGERSTISGAIMQNLFHAIGHFAQLRNWCGIAKR